MSKKIEKQGTEGSLEYCANGPIGVISPMSMTRPKQGIEDKWGDCSNITNNIVNQGTEVSLGYCGNGTMGVRSPISKTRSKLGSEGNGWIAPICLRRLISKASKEVWNIAPMGQ